MEKMKSLDGTLKESLKKFYEKKEGIKTCLEIGFLLISIFVLILGTIEKLNFTSFYFIPSEYKELDIYRILQKIIIVFIFLGMYYSLSFIEINIPTKNFKKVLKILKRGNIKKKKIKKIIIVILKWVIIFFNLLYIGVISVILGLIYYLILADSLILFLPEWFLNKVLKGNELFYKHILYFFLFLNFILFLLYKLSNGFFKKFSKFLIMAVVSILVWYIFKDIFNESEWKRSYELIINNEKIEVVISKKDDKLIVADGKIMESNGLKILKIDTKKYKIKNFEDVTLEYKKFYKVEVENGRK